MNKSLGKGVVTWSFEQYRSNAEKEYDNFWKALFRELIQNSNDAGSAHIDISLDEEKITCSDDGCGMSLDIIQNKLLTIGGSFKDGVAVGGLGKAKELLFFSQPKWIITTNEHMVEGVGGEYEIFELKHPIKGTTVTLFQPENSDWNAIHRALKHVVDRCEIAPEIIIDGDVYRPQKTRGKMVRDLPAMGRLYLTKTRLGKKITGNCYVHVRVNGCWMFDKWVGDHNGMLILDIDSTRLSPLDGLIANRDGLKWKYGDMLDKLVQEIAIDKKSALVKRDPVVTRIRGNGEVAVISASEIDEIVNTLMEEGFDQSLLAGGTENFGINEYRINGMLKGRSSDEEIEEVVAKYMKIVNYEPDFIVYEDPENSSWTTSRIKKFMETQKASTIAQVWTETLKQVCWDNDINIRFTAGFLFTDSDEAMRRIDGDQEQYLINPRFVPPTGIQNKVPFMHYMRTTAVHELTHKYHDYHNEDFMSKYHSLDAGTWDSHRIYAKIGLLR